MATPHIPPIPPVPVVGAGESIQSRLETLIALARLLDRIEHSGPGVGADQYRTVVERLKSALGAQIPAPALEAILSAHPGAAEVYENLHYDVSGLSRHALERSVASEMLAAQAIAKAARKDH